MKKQYFVQLLVSFCFAVSFAAAEDINAIFTKVLELTKNQEYSLALSELAWAEKELNQMHVKKIGEIIPKVVGQFTGGDLKAVAVFGMSNLERSYKGSGGESIKMSLTGSAGSGAGGVGLGSLAALGGLGALAGMGAVSDNTESFRQDGMVFTLNKDENGRGVDASTSIGGQLLKLELNGSDSFDVMKSFINGLKLPDLAKYLGPAQK